jgi:hypothetical protein
MTDRLDGPAESGATRITSLAVGIGALAPFYSLCGRPKLHGREYAGYTSDRQGGSGSGARLPDLIDFDRSEVVRGEVIQPPTAPFEEFVNVLILKRIPGAAPESGTVPQLRVPRTQTSQSPAEIRFANNVLRIKISESRAQGGDHKTRFEPFIVDVAEVRITMKAGPEQEIAVYAGILRNILGNPPADGIIVSVAVRPRNINVDRQVQGERHDDAANR